MAKMTTTHITTDLALWWPYTDQGKTPWRIKTLRMGEKLLHEEKTQINRVWVPHNSNDVMMNDGYKMKTIDVYSYVEMANCV